MTAISVSNDVGLTNVKERNSTVFRPIIENHLFGGTSRDYPDGLTGPGMDRRLKWVNLETDEICNEIDLKKNGDFELAITGNEFKWIQSNRPELIDYILVKGTYSNPNTKLYYYNNTITVKFTHRYRLTVVHFCSYQ